MHDCICVVAELPSGGTLPFLARVAGDDLKCVELGV
jgi:hypothetical protein